MPDLKSELSKVINSWEPEPTKEAPRVYFTTTNNVCRATFDNIRDNPGKTRQENAAMLESAGYKKSSTTSLMGQMVRQGMVRDTGGLLYAINKEYRPIKSTKAFAKQQGAAQPRKKVTITNTRTGEVFNPRPAPAIPNMSMTLEAGTILNNLSIVQARALYDELRKIFGG